MIPPSHSLIHSLNPLLLLLLPFSLMDSSRLHTIVLMAMLGAILVLLVVHADAASVKPSFNMLKLL